MLPTQRHDEQMHAAGRDAKRADDVSKYLEGLDQLGEACAAPPRITRKIPALRPTKNFSEFFAGNAYLSGAVLANKFDWTCLWRPPVEV